MAPLYKQYFSPSLQKIATTAPAELDFFIFELTLTFSSSYILEMMQAMKTKQILIRISPAILFLPQISSVFSHC